MVSALQKEHPVHVNIAFEWVIAGAFTAWRSSYISGCHVKHGGVNFVERRKKGQI